MEFKHLMAYAAVVRRNIFSKAAEELFLSQPTVSMYIRQLEEELNTVLLVRTTKSLEITPKGQEVYEYAVSILSLKDKLIRNCGPNAGDLITIGASTVPSAYLLPEVLAAYRQKNSRIQFTVDLEARLAWTDRMAKSSASTFISPSRAGEVTRRLGWNRRV